MMTILQRALSKWWVVFLITVVVHLVTTRGRGLVAVDTPHYVFLADGLTSGNLGATFNLGAVRWTKIVFLVILAAARAVSSEHWTTIIMAVNVVASGVIAVLLVDLVRRATRSVLATAAALVLHLGCYEFFHWLKFVLTDALFCMTAFVPFYLVARRIVDPDAPPRRGLLVLFLALAMFSRPPGALLVLLVLFVELVLVQKRVRMRTALAVTLAAIAIAFVVRTAVVHQPSRWPLRVLEPKLVEFSAREKKGEVIYDRKEMFHAPPRTAMDHALIQGDRFVRFFQFTTSGFSRMHNLVNIAYFVPLYLLGIVAIVHAFRARDERRRALVIALLMWIGCTAVLHALTVLDFDWRFRAPLMPHFIVLACCGISALASGLQRRDREPAR